MKIVVTGGAGYIGSTVVRRLLELDYHVVVVDNLSKGSRSMLPPEVEIHEVSIDDQAALGKILPRTLAVVHFAASISVGESMKTPLSHFMNNTRSTIALLESVHRHGVGRFVFSSTAAVYGNPQFLPVSENHPLQPVNPYGESKLMVEEILRWTQERTDLKTAILRYFNAAGGRQPRQAVNLIPIVLEVARGTRPYVEVYGTDYPTRDGTAIRDYVCVEDLADAHVLALNALEHHSQLLCNLGNGTGFSVNEVIEAARKVTGKPIPVLLRPRRPGDPPEMVASSDFARRELGWHPRYPDLESIIASAWRPTSKA